MANISEIKQELNSLADNLEKMAKEYASVDDEIVTEKCASYDLGSLAESDVNSGSQGASSFISWVLS